MDRRYIPEVATREQWLVARKSLLEQEKALTRQRDALNRARRALPMVLVEEDYRFETLPHAFGSDRADMVGRKLKQHYRNTPYMAATPLGADGFGAECFQQSDNAFGDHQPGDHPGIQKRRLRPRH